MAYKLSEWPQEWPLNATLARDTYLSLTRYPVTSFGLDLDITNRKRKTLSCVTKRH